MRNQRQKRISLLVWTWTFMTCSTLSEAVDWVTRLVIYFRVNECEVSRHICSFKIWKINIHLFRPYKNCFLDVWAYEIRIYPYKVPPEWNMPSLVNKNRLYKILLYIKKQLLTECFYCFKVAIINLRLKNRKRRENGENRKSRNMRRIRSRAHVPWKNRRCFENFVVEVKRRRIVVGPADPTTNTARLSPQYEGKTRGCHCSHWAPDDGRENARNMLSCKQTSG
jgi:hypothetical protein